MTYPTTTKAERNFRQGSVQHSDQKKPGAPAKEWALTFGDRSGSPSPIRFRDPIRVLLLALFFAMSPRLGAQDFTYVTNATASITITSYNGTNATVDIPDMIDGFPVKAIDRNAFSNKKALEFVRIPQSVESIGDRSF